MTQRIPWSRVLAEGAVIVVSILLAFSIDAWWEERQERRQETEYLAAIIDEMDRNLEAIPGNRRVWERSYSDLMNARSLLQSGAYVDSASVFVMSLNRGLIYGVPSISTAVFDDLRNSGRMVIIQDLGRRRLIIDLYAGMSAELVRFARTETPALAEIVSRHTPPGLIRQIGPRFTLDERNVAPQVLRSAADALGSEEALAGALNTELRRRERERAFLDQHEGSLKAARHKLQTQLSGS